MGRALVNYNYGLIVHSIGNCPVQIRQEETDQVNGVIVWNIIIITGIVCKTVLSKSKVLNKYFGGFKLNFYIKY